MVETPARRATSIMVGATLRVSVFLAFPPGKLPFSLRLVFVIANIPHAQEPGKSQTDFTVNWRKPALR
jgi:hypothetical protein